METVKFLHRAHFQTRFEAVRSFSSAVALLGTFFTQWFMLSCSVALTFPTCPTLQVASGLAFASRTKGITKPFKSLQRKITGMGLGNIALYSGAESHQHHFDLPAKRLEHQDSCPAAFPQCLLLKCCHLHFCPCHGALAVDPAFPTVRAQGRKHSDQLPRPTFSSSEALPAASKPARGSLGCRMCIFIPSSFSMPFCPALTPLSFCRPLWEASVEESQTNWSSECSETSLSAEAINVSDCHCPWPRRES